MEKKKLQEFFSEFWGLKIQEIKDDLKLDDSTLNNHSSVRFYQFIAALESNFDVKVENLQTVITFKDLYNSITK